MSFESDLLDKTQRLSCVIILQIPATHVDVGNYQNTYKHVIPSIIMVLVCAGIQITVLNRFCYLGVS